MSIESVIKELADFNKEYKRVRAEFVKKLEPQFAEVFKGFFDENPNVGGVQWTQYTPYFNDGEECVFSVNDMYLFPIDTDVDDLSDYDANVLFPSFDDVQSYKTVLETGKAPGKYRSYYTDEGFLKQYKVTREQHILNEAADAGLNEENIGTFFKTLTDWEKLQTTLRCIDDDIYKDIFGDHSKIVVTRAGIKVDQIDHD